MNRNTSHRQPTIHSPGARRLAAHVRTLRRREPSFDQLVDAIREGDDRALHALIGRAQHGDAEAAVAVVWALLPRLAAVVINRLPINKWHEAMDDYLTFAYLTLVDVDLTATPDHLNDKIVARTRRRFERSNATEPLALCRPNTLTALTPSQDDVEERAIAHIEIETLVDAVNRGLLDGASWRTLLELRFTAEPGTASVRDRKSASRARIRLQEWAGRAA